MGALHVKESGKGFPVLLLHGFCETHQIWNGVLSALAESYRVLAVDLPGFGKSDLPGEAFSLEDIADIISKWLVEREIDKCVVFGHSLGGYVTLALVKKCPILISGFGLVHSTAFADTAEKKINRNRVIAFVKEHGVRPFVESFIPPLFADKESKCIPEMVELGATTPLQTLIAYTSAMRDRPDRTDVLADFNGKILFLAGDRDGLIPRESIRNQALFCKLPVVAVLEGVAHMGMLENEAETLRQLQTFLRGVIA
jgi:pimeloyl-ACP methyl ester carboxylesterase